ncbi:sensor histidine kinase [Kroppenstedtia sanguinis]|uniref:histidine kinase n=1 Tax=Kroppenstedtia sanguinis TaxID=1380684 RepID=A0ABW4CDG6_9BACL
MVKWVRRWVVALSRWVTSSLRAQMAGFVFLALLVAFLLPQSLWLYGKLTGFGVTHETKYYYPSAEEVREKLQQLTVKLTRSQEVPLDQLEGEEEHFNELISDSSLSYALTDGEGRVLMGAGNLSEHRMDLHRFLRQVETQDEEPGDRPESREIAAVYPFTHLGEEYYLFGVKRVKGRPITYEIGNPVLSLVIGILGFLLTFVWLTRGKLGQIRALAQGMDRIAEGDFSLRLKERGRDELASLTSNINQMAARLETARERERAWEQNRMELITHISHDLRSPLTSMIGYLQVMRDNPDAEREEFLRYGGIALSKAQGLQRLIDDLFEYAKLTHPDTQMQRERISLTRLLEQLVEEASVSAEAKGIRLKTKLPDDPLMLTGDPSLLVRLFGNLLDNALYHGAGGPIQVHAIREGDWAKIRVANPVDDLDPALLERLFDTFVMGDASRGKGGSGLGLAIAHSATELHGGEIHVEGVEGEIQFHIRLPLARQGG